MHKAKLKKAKLDQCRICGDGASYSYFGVITCDPCKMFFKRYGENREKDLRCDFDGQCEINLLTRHVCTACRLRKCFQCGMQSGMIRHNGRTRDALKRITTSNSLIPTTTSLLPRVNLLQQDISRLTTDQWTLFSNLTNTYNLSKLIMIGQRMRNDVGLTRLTTINRDLVKEFLGYFYEEAGLAYRNNPDVQRLSSADRSILLHTAADHTSCLGGVYVFAAERLPEHRDLMNYLIEIYGSETMKYHCWSTTFVHQDVVLFKLALALFSLSTSSRTSQPSRIGEYFDQRSVLQIENKYAELTWKYLLYRYTFEEAVKRYVQIIQWFLAMSVFMSYAHSAQVHLNDVESLVEQTEINLILDDVDEIAHVDKK